MRSFSRVLLVALSCLALESSVARAQETPPAPEADDAGDAVPAEEPDPLFDDDEFDLDFDELPGFPDPLEPMNRGILRFNQELDRWVLDPVTRFYRFAFPGFVRTGIRNVFLNADMPPVIVNDVLQLEFRDAGVSVGRFVVNTIFGLGGMIDASQALDLEPHESDFGQTLALAGAPSGPYLVLPVLGPSTIRDGAGEVVDALLRPTTYFFPLFSPQQLFYTGGVGITIREQQFESLKALEEGSVDYYAALRSAFYQNRQAQIWGRRDHRREDWDVEGASD